MEILIVVAIALVMLCMATIPMAIYQYSTIGHETIKVSDKSIKVNSVPVISGKGRFSGFASHSVFMIFTDNGQALVNKNTILFWKFTSAEMQGRLKPKHTYKIKTSGLRIPFLGLYKNIIEIE